MSSSRNICRRKLVSSSASRRAGPVLVRRAVTHCFLRDGTEGVRAWLHGADFSPFPFSSDCLPMLSYCLSSSFKLEKKKKRSEKAKNHCRVVRGWSPLPWYGNRHSPKIAYFGKSVQLKLALRLQTTIDLWHDISQDHHTHLNRYFNI